MDAALRANRTMQPPSHFVFGTDVLELYFRTRESLRDEAREATRRLDASSPAREQVMVEKNRRWLASVPFGVGQFQNQDMTLGYTLLAAETALAATAITSMAVQLNTYQRALTSEDGDLRRANHTNETASTLLTISAWSFGVVTLAGIIEANLAFVPERRRIVTQEEGKDRDHAGSVALDVALGPGGVSVHGLF